MHDFKRLGTVANHTGGAGADTLTGGDGADTFVYNAAVGDDQAGSEANLTAEGDDTITDFESGTDNLEFSVELLNDVIVGEAPFEADDALGQDAGAFVEIGATNGNGAATASATSTAGTFFYDSNTGSLIFDANGLTGYTDDGNTGFTGTKVDDIVIAEIQVAGEAGGVGAIDADDFTFV